MFQQGWTFDLLPSHTCILGRPRGILPHIKLAFDCPRLLPSASGVLLLVQLLEKKMPQLQLEVEHCIALQLLRAWKRSEAKKTTWKTMVAALKQADVRARENGLDVYMTGMILHFPLMVILRSDERSVQMQRIDVSQQKR